MRFIRLLVAPLLWSAALVETSHAQPPAPADPQALVKRIQDEVAELRGLPFKRPVPAEKQTSADFGKYLDRELNESQPLIASPYYGKIVRKLGLYRGPELQNGRELMKLVASSQAAAYYDPGTQKFYILMADMPELLAGVMYSHELYHGLQDQYFNLNRYLLQRAHDGSLDGDELMARQAVVEGEATYVMNLWVLKKTLGAVPPRESLSMIVNQQAQMTTETLRESLKQPQVAAFVGKDIAQSVDAMDRIPPFLIDNLIGAYLKGLGFVYALQAQGWPEVEKLYTEYPPVSTEQILHPEKWLAHEAPSKFTWPEVAAEKSLAQWELLDQDVLGEMQWISIFKEYGMAGDAPSIAAGWDGDRYAVFKRKNSDALLLLIRTSWDSPAEATEFAEAYRKLLAVKYADSREPTRVVQKDAEVTIVEGGPPEMLDTWLKIAAKASKRRATGGR